MESAAPIAIFVFVGVLSQLLFTGVLYLWARWVVGRQGRGWSWLLWAPWIGFAVQTLGVLFTVASLVSTFSQVASLPPEQKAVVLASSISSAMLGAAFGGVAGGGAQLLALLGCASGSLRAPIAEG